ncbi:MAG: hypothetical protein JKP98_14650 [Rhodobacteraceae bacterium]|nr:hypothetical protein [Paracoccaceae bacterium]
MRAVRTREVVRERWGWGDDPFVSRRTDYARPLRHADEDRPWGFAALDGTHEHDNRSTLRAYTRNLEKYIVDTPKIEIAGSWGPPSASPNDTRGWLSARFFTYDRALHRGGWANTGSRRAGQCHRSGILERGGRPALAPRRCPLHL